MLEVHQQHESMITLVFRGGKKKNPTTLLYSVQELFLK